MSCLLEAAEQTLGHKDADNKLIKQLAYENANLSCKAVLHSKIRDKDLNEMTCLCRDVDTFTHKMSQTVHVAMGPELQPVMATGAALQQTGPQKGCFKCGQPGHFDCQCPLSSPLANVPQPSGGLPPPTLHSPTPPAHGARRTNIGLVPVNLKQTSLEILCLPFRETDGGANPRAPNPSHFF